MKVFVTGGSGFVGGHANEGLVRAGHEAVALARSPAADDKVRGYGATPVRGDLATVEHAAAFVEEWGTRARSGWSPVVTVDQGMERLLAAQRVGAGKVTDQAVLAELLGPRFEGAIATAIGKLTYAEVEKERATLEDLVTSIAGSDLDGFVVHEVHLGEIVQVPVEKLDPDDILDAEAIRNITEATLGDSLRTQEMRREMRRATAEQDVAAREAELRLEVQQTRAELEHAQRIEEMKK